MEFEEKDRAYRIGFSEGYSKAENDYFSRSEKDRQDSYDCGYQQGKEDAMDELMKFIGDVWYDIDDLNVIYNKAEQIKEQKNE